MALDDLDKLEIWYLSWFTRMRTLAVWSDLRDEANRIMDAATLEIARLRSGC